MGTPRRVGFVGAGDLAPVHVEAVQALTGVLAVGVHDIEAPRATSLADRYGLRAVATLEELVGLGVDVVHRRFDCQIHGFYSMPAAVPAGAEAIARAVGLLRAAFA